MQELEAQGRVGASAAEVFSIVADVESWPQILRSVESIRLLTGRPVGNGVRLSEARIIFGELRRHEMEIVEFQAPRRLRLRVDDPDINFQLDHIVDAVSGMGTQLTLMFRTRLTSLAERAAHPFLRPALFPVVQRELERDVADLLGAVREQR